MWNLNEKWNCFKNKDEIHGQSGKHISDTTITVEETGLGKQQGYLLLLATGEEINSQQILNPKDDTYASVPS